MFPGPEGATLLDPNETRGLKHKHVATRGELDELEQDNIQRGGAWLGRKRKGDILTLNFLCKLHDKLFGDVWRWAGRFRNTEKNIGVAPLQVAVQLHALCGDARFWAENATWSPKEAAARFHHRLVKIHPFPNGNGRHARIAADEYLKQYFNEPPIDWATGVNLQADSARRTAYIAALRAADGEDYGPLLVFVGAQEQPPAGNFPPAP
ncbi:mobile mystery protein B [Desulfovibrio oxamicus]|uniref:Mobile mystery protein B n=1 Tax=Nitratidesulfovibrio oxamicus TaxID=32016 RepID=A0ABS0J4R4_9BACT|nr:mobile mystery protein B [Nitratidesulfovibrio oxamicus]MBG3877417.1 mobile mystery protein B [Nitratidesulfovibrio oxamicus]